MSSFEIIVVLIAYAFFFRLPVFRVAFLVVFIPISILVGTAILPLLAIVAVYVIFSGQGNSVFNVRQPKWK